MLRIVPGVSRRIFALALTLLLAAPPALPQKKTAPRPAPAKSVTKKKERADVVCFRVAAEKIFSEPKYSKAYFGALVLDPATGETLYERNADSFFSPASVTKIFSTAFALGTLGSDYRFHTTLESAAPLDPATGRLAGDLVLVGRGDPNLSNLRLPFTKDDDRDGPAEKILAALTEQLVAKGVREIDGNIVADDTFFADDRYPVGWAIGDLTWRPGAPVSAIALNDNTVTLIVTPGVNPSDPATYTIEPASSYFTVVNEVTTAPQKVAVQLGLRREPGSRVIRIWGTVAAGASPRKLIVAVDEPAEHAVFVLKRLLEERGITVTGATRAQHVPVTLINPTALPPLPAELTALSSRTIFAEHTSLPLIEAVRVVNKISRNLHAEMLLRTATRTKTPEVSAETAALALRDFLKSIGIAETDLSLADGSGLSRNNLVTPRATAALLAWVLKQPWAEDYISTLAVAGQDGTLEDRMKKSSAFGRVRAKTGTLNGVNGLAGFAEIPPVPDPRKALAGSGPAPLVPRRLLFVFFADNHILRGADATAPLDALATALIESFR